MNACSAASYSSMKSVRSAFSMQIKPALRWPPAARYGRWFSRAVLFNLGLAYTTAELTHS